MLIPPCEGGWGRDAVLLLEGNWDAGPKAPFQTEPDAAEMGQGCETCRVRSRGEAQ